jgi:hypothetical protein
LICAAGLPTRSLANIVACATDSIRTFAENAAAGAAPLRVITGASTGIVECYDVAVDTVHAELFVAHGPVSVFALDANGDVAPLRQIIVSSTFAVSVAVDVQSDEIVIGGPGGQVLTYERTASGSATPKRSLDVSAYLDDAVAVFVDRPHGQIAVSSYTSPYVYFFDRLATGQATAVGSPISVTSPRGLFIDPLENKLYVASSSGIPVYDLATRANLGGVSSGSFWGLAVVRSTDQLWVGYQSPNTSDPDPLLVFSRGASGNVSPNVAVNAAAPALKNLNGIAATRAAGCGSGHVACDSVFRDSFDRLIQ